MVLDGDAEALATMFGALLPEPFHKLGVEGSRAFMEGLNANMPPPTPVRRVIDLDIPGPGGPLPIRVYYPQPEQDLPVVLYFHGGGWVLGSLDSADAICRELSSISSSVVVSVDYRLAPEHPFPAAVEDAYAALQWVAAHGAELKADTTRLAVGGDSAGATLAAAVCLIARDSAGPPIAMQLLAYPVTEYAVDRPSWTEHAQAPLLSVADVLWFWDQYLPSDTLRTDPRATPSSAPDLSGLPPAFILTATNDPTRDGAENYARLLADAGVETKRFRYPGVFHGFFTLVGLLNRTKDAVDDAAEHLKKYLGQPTISPRR